MTRQLLCVAVGCLCLVALGCGRSAPCPPGPPHDLKIVSISAGTVVLSWEAGPGAPTSYILEAGTAPGTSDESRIDLHNAATTYTATGVKPGTYYARVLSVSRCGTGPASNEVVAVVP